MWWVLQECIHALTSIGMLCVLSGPQAPQGGGHCTQPAGTAAGTGTRGIKGARGLGLGRRRGAVHVLEGCCRIWPSVEGTSVCWEGGTLLAKELLQDLSHAVKCMYDWGSMIWGRQSPHQLAAEGQSLIQQASPDNLMNHGLA